MTSHVKRTRYLKTKGYQTGISLVESLVAMLVLSIGMLGIAALYVESLRSGRSALARTQAVMLVSDMADRMRANSGVANLYVKTADATGSLSTACNGGSGTCTPANMAANDIAVWHQMVDDRADNPASGQLGLPNGRGTIAITTAGPPRIMTITVQWEDAGATSSYALRLRI
jgi:type IV pilus assembly protein PilV